MLPIAIVLLAAVPSRSERVAIVPVVIMGETEEGPSLSRLVDAVVEVIRRRVTLELVSDEELFVVSSERASDCGSDRRCTVDRLSRAGVDKGVLFVVNRLVEPPLISVRILDVRTGTVTASQTGPRGREEGSVEQALAGRLTQLLRDEHPETGRLIVRPTPRTAVVTVGRDVGPTFILEPGTHDVRTTHDGYEPNASQVLISAGATVELEVSLSEPGVSPWVWVGVGMGAAAAVAAAVTATVLLTRDPCLCVRRPGEICGC